MKLQRIEIALIGTTPLMMHNPILADPLAEITQSIAEFTSKRKKTDEDHREIARLEFVGGLYYRDDIGPYVPAVAVHRCIQEGAKLTKNGVKVQRGLRIVQNEFPLDYIGPRTLDALQKDEDFRDRRTVVVNRNRTIRTRPYFRDWSLIAEFDLNEDILNYRDLKLVLEDAGNHIGLLEARVLRFGLFDAKVRKV